MMVWKLCERCGVEYEHISGPFKSDRYCGTCARELWLKEQPLKHIDVNFAIEKKRRVKGTA